MPASHDAASTPGRQAPSIRFGAKGRFELEPAERRLRIDGQPAALGARALDLLAVLARQPDRLVTKGELLDAVWGDLVVEEANLHVQIGHVRRVLGGDVIATVPGRGYRFVAPIVADDAAVAGASSAAPAPRPAGAPGTGLHGRVADLERLEAALADGGCITLVGPAGVGKTTLARAAHDRRSGARCWVDLGPLVEGRQVADALARALGVQLDDAREATPQLRAALSAEARLVVVDNAEHVVAACAELIAGLSGVSAVTWLVTSQWPLAIASERLQRLDPLALGDGDDGALGLLVRRIVAHDHRFAVTPANRPLLGAICEQLDGLPLALEMAAARVPSLGVRGVHDGLAHRFSLLTRGHRGAAERHRTLHQAIDWSWRLLTVDEQALFRRLGVFAGGFDLTLALAVAGDGPAGSADAQDEADDRAEVDARRWATVDALATLVDRSLVAVDADDPPRYRLLETLRAFALEQLARAVEPSPEEPDVRRRHARAVLQVYEGWRLGDAAILARCLAEMANAREAIAWAQVNDLSLAARLTAAVTSPMSFSVWRHETTAWLLALEPAMSGPDGRALPARVQASWWVAFAQALVMRRDPRAAAVARHGYRLWQPLGQPERALVAAVSWVRAPRPGPDADLDAACAALDASLAALPAPTVQQRLQAEGARVVAALARSDDLAALDGRLRVLALAQEVGATDWIDAAESNVVSALNTLDRHAEAAARGSALLARIRARGDAERNGNLPWVYAALLLALAMNGQRAEARALVPDAVAACERAGVLLLLPALARLAFADGRTEDAARLIGHARGAHGRRGIALERDDARTLDRVEAQLVERLGVDAITRFAAEGGALDDAAAAALYRAG